MGLAPRRVRALLTAGLLDSFGLSLGWTAFLLIAVGRGGLAAAGEYNAAMLAGVVCSAPVTAWFASRVGGRMLLGCTGSVELVLRVGTLAGLLIGWPPALLAVGVAAMNVAAWAGYAGMRAEVAAVDPGPRSLTRYAVAIAAIEAVGASVAALLPITGDGRIGGTVTAVILVVYGSSVIPQFLCARTSVVRSGRQVRSEAGVAGASGAVDALPRGAVDRVTDPAAGLMPATEELSVPEPAYVGRHRLRPPIPLPMPFGRQAVALFAGGLIMLIASGPVTLGTALAQELYGHAAVGFAAMAFSAGCLLAGPVAAALCRLGLPGHLRWTLWGAGMLLGWLVAPSHLAGLLGAQLLSAITMTAFQGEMDATVSEAADASRVTSALAWSAAVRACGSAVAVRMLPMLVAAPAIGMLSAAATAILLGGALAGITVAKLCGAARRHANPVPVAHGVADGLPADPAAGRQPIDHPAPAEPMLHATLPAEPPPVERSLAGAGASKAAG